jgi:RimJ/RimL family protein N-acetyltransferase
MGDDGRVDRITELTDGVVTLRPVAEAHVDGLHAGVAASIAEMAPWLPWCHDGYQRAEMAEFVRHARRTRDLGTEHHLATLDARDGHVLGACALRITDERSAMGEIGYWVATPETGRGVAARSTRLLAAWGFTGLGLERIEVIPAVTNLASRTVAERAGATYEGVARNRIPLGGGTRADAAIYAFVRGDLG